jgi:uncharacterized protein DUF6526
MADRVQTYKNHARLLPPFHFFVLPVLLGHFLNQIRHFWLWPSLMTAWATVVALAILTLAFYARVMALKVQDRVIRMEMRMRLAGLLPPDLQSRINDLTPQQLVALRFACDAELPGLVREVLDGRLKTSKEIKLRVKDWEADWLRA